MCNFTKNIEMLKRTLDGLVNIYITWIEELISVSIHKHYTLIVIMTM